jgi:magnesium transporter
MPRTTKRRAKKVGLPAESLVYTGEKSRGKVDITIMDYDEQTFEERVVQTADQCFPYRDKPTATWVNVDGVHDPVMLEKMGECFGLHRLVTEDIMSVVQRPKVEDFGDYLFIVLKMLTYDDTAGRVIPEQVSLVVGRNYLLSFQEGIKGDVFHLVRDHLRTGRGRSRKMGVDYLAYALLDAVVDGYFIVLERLGERIDALEEVLMTRNGNAAMHQVYRLKRELLFLHKAVWPLREVIASLQRRESPLVRETTAPYLRDVYDHLIQVVDTVEIYRDILSEMLSTHLTVVSNRLNEIMRVLTVIATIFMPLTFIAGVYGMNFKHMPELEWEYGYLLAWIVMAGVGVTMFLYFRSKKWMD